jgi:hypothetical protein
MCVLQDGPKEFQRVVASLLRDSPRPLLVTFIAPATDADLVISHAVLQKFIAQLEPAHLPSRMQEQLLAALHDNASEPSSQAYGEKVRKKLIITIVFIHIRALTFCSSNTHVHNN